MAAQVRAGDQPLRGLPPLDIQRMRKFALGWLFQQQQAAGARPKCLCQNTDEPLQKVFQSDGFRLGAIQAKEGLGLGFPDL